MLTNLLATVVISLVTNTTEKVTGYSRYVPDSCPNTPQWTTNGSVILLNCLVNHTKGVDPNEKTISTTCERVTKLTFEFMGKPQSVEAREIIWQTNRVYRLEWIIPDSGFRIQ